MSISPTHWRKECLHTRLSAKSGIHFYQKNLSQLTCTKKSSLNLLGQMIKWRWNWPHEAFHWFSMIKTMTPQTKKKNRKITLKYWHAWNFFICFFATHRHNLTFHTTHFLESMLNSIFSVEKIPNFPSHVPHPYPSRHLSHSPTGNKQFESSLKTDFQSYSNTE